MNRDDRHRQARITMLRRELTALEAGSRDMPALGLAIPGHQTYANYARAVLKARARFSAHFDASLFSDPAFDMLLCLFGATEDGQSVTTNVCCTAARVPRTTALRWIKLLMAHGHVLATDDPTDRRSTLLRLSPAARDAVQAWLDECMAIPLHH